MTIRCLIHIIITSHQPCVEGVTKPFIERLQLFKDYCFSNILEIFEETLSHEQEVTRRINELVHLAKEERDFATDIFLQWFVTEQVEEEETVKDIISKLRMIKGEGQGMLVLDKDMSARTFTPPPAN